MKIFSIFQAVQLDTKDGISWSILGNAYLAHFFSVSQNPRTLKQAMSAYKQAVSFFYEKKNNLLTVFHFFIFLYLYRKKILLHLILRNFIITKAL